MEEIWSNTDFPYMCLKDEKRTLTFKKAIEYVVKPGDIVVDVGSGSGILSFFAAAAGAKKVYAVEIEHTLAQQLRKSVILNGFEGKIEVIEKDIFKADLPKDVDIIIAEIIDTGLLDELQVPAINDLRKKGVISNKTKIIPFQYQTFFELVYSNNLYYGYKIVAPKHEWPFYTNLQTDWVQTEIESVSNKVEIAKLDFMAGFINDSIDKTVEFTLPLGKIANAIRISGLITLTENIQLGATNALNGDKIISIEPIKEKEMVKIKISYKMGNGLGKLQWRLL